MTERDLATICLRTLNALPGCYALKTQPPGVCVGTPDLIGCYRGGMFAVELKVGANVATAIQAEQLYRWARAGATVGICYTLEQVLALVDHGGVFIPALNLEVWEKCCRGHEKRT
jgi:hypothetical protein